MFDKQIICSTMYKTEEDKENKVSPLDKLYETYMQDCPDNPYNELDFSIELNQSQADMMYKDWEKYRETFTWGRSLDAQGNYLEEPQRIKLCNISDDHLESLILWTVRDYEPYIHVAFCRELGYRRENNIYVEDYL